MASEAKPAHYDDYATFPIAQAEPVLAHDGIVMGEWETDLLSCFDDLVPNCLMATFLPCISLAQITSRMGLYPFGSALFFFLIAMFLSPMTLIGTFLLRGKIRERFQIPGTVIEDFLVSWLCSCCAIAQMATHVKSYKRGSCDFGPVDTLPPYMH